MGYDLDKRVEDDLISIAVRNGIKKIILFGSRARGDNSERSDIDIALRTCLHKVCARLCGNLSPLTASKSLEIRKYSCGFFPCHR